MTIFTGGFLTFSAIGNKEDLIETITNIDPVETPILDAAGKTTAKAALHEWQTQSLASAAANAQLEGDNIQTYGAVTATARVVNRCQISYKAVSVSDRQNKVDKAGRKSEMVMQLMLKNKELQRDQEFILTNNQAPVSGSSGTANQLRPLNSFYPAGTSNRDATSGAAGTSSTAATDSSATRAFTEDLLKDVLQKCWVAGGKADLIVVTGTQKQVSSTFTGNATRQQSPDGKKLYSSFSVYVDDFGEHKVVPDRFSRTRDCHVLDTSLINIAYLQKPYTKDLATTGLATNGVVVADWTLEVLQPAGIGIVADLT